LYRIAFASELEVEENVMEILRDAPNITPAYCAACDHVRLFLSCPDEALLERKSREIVARFGTRLLRPEHHTLPQEMVAMLRERNCTLATAESCTGGLIAAAITDIPGSSAVFRGSVIAYSDEIKRDILGVSSTVLQTYGSVSGQCVSAMVENLGVKFHAEAGIAVSGIAGPGGGTPAKPVGLVFIAAKLGQRTVIRECHFSGNRDAVRRITVAAALNELRNLLLEN
ncbi:MAG: CinA family protein, partial [Victivallales bacterium]|nr:CinA family protein [Victivallales bacterium]